MYLTQPEKHKNLSNTTYHAIMCERVTVRPLWFRDSSWSAVLHHVALQKCRQWVLTDNVAWSKYSFAVPCCTHFQWNPDLTWDSIGCGCYLETVSGKQRNHSRTYTQHLPPCHNMWYNHFTLIILFFMIMESQNCNWHWNQINCPALIWSISRTICICHMLGRLLMFYTVIKLLNWSN